MAQPYPHVDHPATPTHISLCAGYGGIDIGLRRAIRGLRTIALSEIEAFACANLVAKMEAGLLDLSPIWTDLRTFPFRRFRGLVDILSGGFPCQPFSSIGGHGGDEDPRHLFPFIRSGIIEILPGFVFLENVEGIISAKLKGDGWRDPAGTPVLLHVLRELERVGYRATAGLFSSSEIGATHRRNRVFILAMAYGLDPRLEGYAGNEHSPRWAGTWQSGSVGKSCFLLRGDRPRPPGCGQWDWEPSRVISGGRKAKPPLDGNSHGASHGVDYAELCRTMGDHIDETRLLGNGVDPDVAERAFRVLYGRLTAA